MDETKEFSSFEGFAVKDKKARDQINAISSQLTQLQDQMSNNNNSGATQKVATADDVASLF